MITQNFVLTSSMSDHYAIGITVRHNANLKSSVVQFRDSSAAIIDRFYENVGREFAAYNCNSTDVDHNILHRISMKVHSFFNGFL